MLGRYLTDIMMACLEQPVLTNFVRRCLGLHLPEKVVRDSASLLIICFRLVPLRSHPSCHSGRKVARNLDSKLDVLKCQAGMK